MCVCGRGRKKNCNINEEALPTLSRRSYCVHTHACIISGSTCRNVAEADDQNKELCMHIIRIQAASEFLLLWIEVIFYTREREMTYFIIIYEKRYIIYSFA